MLELRVEAMGETLIERKLMRFADDLEVPDGALEDAATVLREATREQFDSEGGASGGWAPLSEARVREKARLGLDPHILRATDRLRDSLTLKFDPDHIERLSGTSLLFGSNVGYGIYHQSSRPRSAIPFRPPLAFTAEKKREIVKAVQASLVASMRAIA